MPKKFDEYEFIDAVKKFKSNEKDFVERRTGRDRRQIFISPHLLKEDRRLRERRELS